MKQRSLRAGIILLGIWLAVSLGSQFGVDLLWFTELGYSQIYWTRFWTQAGIGTIVTSISLLFCLSNLRLAQRLRDRVQHNALKPPTELGTLSPFTLPDASPASAPRQALSWLLPLTLGVALLISFLMGQVGQVTLTLWQPNLAQLDVLPRLPEVLQPHLIWSQFQSLRSATSPIGLVALGAIGCVVIGLLIYPDAVLTTVAVGLSLLLGFILASYWDKWLLAFHPTRFNLTDPLFTHDIGFYIFSLPSLKLLEFWLVELFGFAIAAVALINLLAGNSLSQGIYRRLTRSQQRHLFGLGGCGMIAIGLTFWLARYELLYQTRGVVYGAGYTDVKFSLPADTGLSVLAVAIALLCLAAAVQKPIHPALIQLAPRLLLLYWGCVPIVLLLLPAICQSLIVQPNELAVEQPYLRHSIAFTRKAFDLEAIRVEVFDPLNNLTASDLLDNRLTIRNIRLWDTRPLLQTNRQLQQIRPYYAFPDADIDRYTLFQQVGKSDNASQTPAKQQVLIAARELDYNSVPQDAKTWVNEHLVYTHGYGFTLSPVNRVAAGGLPDYYVKDIGTEANPGELSVPDPRVRASIPIAHPRIYYGEIANTYVMTGTRVPELDYPSGNDNAYNTYNGTGGIGLGALWRRWLFAYHLKDWQMLFTTDFTANTKLLFRRNINERVRRLAPFLRYDQDPYLVVADLAGEDNTASQNHLFWILDAYTTSDLYPYSDPGQFLAASVAEKPFNYIRNSIKIVVDAYDGAVTFFVADPKDPLIQAWQSVFPGTFQPLDAMRAPLRSHIRYPNDLFSVQSDRLLNYHMTDPTVFYNREDQWQVPREIYGSETLFVEPYYLITKLPNASSEEFTLVLPFTPKQRTNLTGWLAARSDGTTYGTALLYDFPKQKLIYGTEQIEARINQDPVISQQISLWNRTGSRAVQGNLLVIPIDQSLLYVEPLYLEAEKNSLPTLVRVIVAYENRIVMAETLDQALQAIFKPETPAAPVVRPVE